MMRHHGTVTSYINGKCRCEKCTEAHRLYVKGRRANRLLEGQCTYCARPHERGKKLCTAHRIYHGKKAKEQHQRAAAKREGKTN